MIASVQRIWKNIEKSNRGSTQQPCSVCGRHDVQRLRVVIKATESLSLSKEEDKERFYKYDEPKYKVVNICVGDCWKCVFGVSEFSAVSVVNSAGKVIKEASCNFKNPVHSAKGGVWVSTSSSDLVKQGKNFNKFEVCESCFINRLVELRESKATVPE